MVTKSKLRQLEGHVLPDQPEPCKFYISNDAEIALASHAENIKRKYRPEVSELLDDQTLTFDQKTTQAMKLLKNIPPNEQDILDKSHAFDMARLADMMQAYFEDRYPKNQRDVLAMRIHWVLSELSNQGNIESIIECEWLTNRDESKEDFDDFAWWDAVDKKVAEYYPHGCFTKKSWEAYETRVDELRSKFIREYWKEHPEAYENVMKELKHE